MSLKQKIIYKEKLVEKEIKPLGKPIYVSPKASVSINPPMEVHYMTPTVSVLIGIGEDEVAELIMDIDAWEALKSGAEINITTVQKLKK